MEILTLTVLLIVITWILYIVLKQRGRPVGNSIPGPKGYPLVGTALELTPDNIYEKFYQFSQRYGDIFQIQIFQTTNVLLNSADLVNKAFCGDKYKAFFNNRPKFFLAEKIYHGSQTISSYKDANDNVHSGLRKAFAKSLHVYGEGIPIFEQHILSEIKRVVAELEALEGKEFEFISFIRVPLSNIISILLIGEPAEVEDVQSFWDLVWHQDFFLNAMRNSVLLAFPFLVHTPGSYKKRYGEVLAAKQRIIEKYFHRQKATRKSGTVRGIVDWYLNNQQEDNDQGRVPFLTDELISFNILETVLAGVITTMTSLSNTLVCLLAHEEYQKKVQDELDEVVGHQRYPSISDRRRCPCIEAVTLESLRYLTPVPLLAPHIVSRDLTFEGFAIKENTTVFPNVWYIHHDAKVWGDPWVFRPERFLDDDGDIIPNTHPFRKSWLPFGTGRRQCPGEGLARSRLFLLVGCLFQRFNFLGPETGRIICDPRKGEFDRNITFRPKPFYCRAVKRELKEDVNN